MVRLDAAPAILTVLLLSIAGGFNILPKTEAFLVTNVAVSRIGCRQQAKAHCSPRNMMAIPYESVLPSITSLYTTSLMEHPLPTKSATACVLCSLGDYLAQRRDPTIRTTDWARLIRFSVKGLGGGIIWAMWYDAVDGMVDSFLYTMNPFADGENSMTESASNNLKVVISMALEQFLWCPIVFGLWEIPVATLMNGGKVETIPSEVRGKLNGLLWDNAKVWTPANLLIYNVPLEFRLGVSNLVDILWQSIVADMAADCGNVSPKATTDPGVAVVTEFLTQNSTALMEETEKVLLK